MAKNISSHSSSRLAHLEARMDGQLHSFMEEEEPRKKKPLIGVIGAAGLGAAGYANRDKIKAGAKKVATKSGVMAKDAARKGLRATARGAGVASNDLYQGMTRGAKGSVSSKMAGKASGVLAKTSKKLRAVSRMFDSAQVDRIVELSRRIEDLREI